MRNDEAQQYFLNRNKLELMSVAYCEFQGIFMEPNTYKCIRIKNVKSNTAAKILWWSFEHHRKILYLIPRSKQLIGKIENKKTV